MEDQSTEQLRYPVGRFQLPDLVSKKQLEDSIQEIASFPDQLRRLVQGASSEQKQNRYRPGGWTLLQVVHHCADSHLNSLIRFKWTLTEDQPTIKAYNETKWAELPDALNEDLEPTLCLLDGLHKRWVELLQNLNEEQWNRAFVHPDSGETIRLDQSVVNYAWHCRHHLAHIRRAIGFNNKFN